MLSRGENAGALLNYPRLRRIDPSELKFTAESTRVISSLTCDPLGTSNPANLVSDRDTEKTRGQVAWKMLRLLQCVMGDRHCPPGFDVVRAASELVATASVDIAYADELFLSNLLPGNCQSFAAVRSCWLDASWRSPQDFACFKTSPQLYCCSRRRGDFTNRRKSVKGRNEKSDSVGDKNFKSELLWIP